MAGFARFLMAYAVGQLCMFTAVKLGVPLWTAWVPGDAQDIGMAAAVLAWCALHPLFQQPTP